MSDLANAVASPVVEEIGGKSFEFRPLSLKDWGAIERQAKQQYRRELIELYSKNLDLMPEHMRDEAIQKAFDRAEAIDVDDLPEKSISMPEIDPKTRKPVRKDGKFVLTTKKVPYAIWWGSESFEGKMFAIWLSMRRARPDMTLDDVDQLLSSESGEAMQTLERLAGVVGNISQPSVGN